MLPGCSWMLESSRVPDAVLDWVRWSGRKMIDEAMSIVLSLHLRWAGAQALEVLPSQRAGSSGSVDALVVVLVSQSWAEEAAWALVQVSPSRSLAADAQHQSSEEHHQHPTSPSGSHRSLFAHL